MSTPAIQISSPTSERGVLYLVPAPLDFGCPIESPLIDVMPDGTLKVASQIRVWVCENAKSTRAFLKRVGEVHALCTTIQDMQLQELPREIHKKGDHQVGFNAQHLLQAALQGENIGLVSEAGMPAIADPGSSVVRAAHAMGLRVVPLVGPISLLLALAASGLNGQNFAFVGYLPSKPTERVPRIKELESLALKTGQTQLFIETPYRNVAMLQALIQGLQPNTRLAVSSGLTLSQATSHSDSVKMWRQQPWSMANDIPAVFAIGA